MTPDPADMQALALVLHNVECLPGGMPTTATPPATASSTNAKRTWC
jgi:hypothetical protein